MIFINDVFKEIISKKQTENVKYYFTIQPSDQMIKEMVAFANTDGGYIFWGIKVNTELELIGLTKDLNIRERLQQIINKIPAGLNYSISEFVVETKIIIGIKIYKSNINVLLNGRRYIVENNSCKTVNPKIFISHSSKDKKYGAAFVRLLEDIGVDSTDIIFTSDDEHGIPLEFHIFDYLKNQIDNNCYMVYLLSDNYFDSPACLNEMGAAWVKTNDYIVMGTPDFSFSNEKFNGTVIDTKKKGFSMGNKSQILNFRNLIQEKLEIEKIDEIKWTIRLDEYLDKIKN